MAPLSHPYWVTYPSAHEGTPIFNCRFRADQNKTFNGFPAGTEGTFCFQSGLPQVRFRGAPTVSDSAPSKRLISGRWTRTA
jgi:hypothetical protein